MACGPEDLGVMLVSAIMPTRGRSRGAWGEQAVESFLRQTYPHRELIILDDVDDPTFPTSIAKLEGVHYLRRERETIYRKRNRLCGMASGTIVCHWDSDDWSSPDRIADQVARLRTSAKAVTGYHSMLFHDETSLRWAKYIGHPGYALGTSLCYQKAFWQLHPFREDPSELQVNKNVGEDGLFVKDAVNRDELASVDAEKRMVARAHADNTSPKVITNPMAYRPVAASEAPRGFFL